MSRKIVPVCTLLGSALLIAGCCLSYRLADSGPPQAQIPGLQPGQNKSAAAVFLNLHKRELLARSTCDDVAFVAKHPLGPVPEGYKHLGRIFQLEAVRKTSYIISVAQEQHWSVPRDVPKHSGAADPAMEYRAHKKVLWEIATDPRNSSRFAKRNLFNEEAVLVVYLLGIQRNAREGDIDDSALLQLDFSEPIIALIVRGADELQKGEKPFDLGANWVLNFAVQKGKEAVYKEVIAKSLDAVANIQFVSTFDLIQSACRYYTSQRALSSLARDTLESIILTLLRPAQAEPVGQDLRGAGMETWQCKCEFDKGKSLAREAFPEEYLGESRTLRSLELQAEDLERDLIAESERTATFPRISQRTGPRSPWLIPISTAVAGPVSSSTLPAPRASSPSADTFSGFMKGFRFKCAEPSQCGLNSIPAWVSGPLNQPAEAIDLKPETDPAADGVGLDAGGGNQRDAAGIGGNVARKSDPPERSPAEKRPVGKACSADEVNSQSDESMICYQFTVAIPTAPANPAASALAYRIHRAALFDACRAETQINVLDTIKAVASNPANEIHVVAYADGRPLGRCPKDILSNVDLAKKRAQWVVNQVCDGDRVCEGRIVKVPRVGGRADCRDVSTRERCLEAYRRVDVEVYRRHPGRE